MALLPTPEHTTVAEIYRQYEKKQVGQVPRPHLGASLIGKECSRSIWYDFRWCTPAQFEGRMLRLFDTGNKEEFRLSVDLRNAGVTVYEKDPSTGAQFQFKDLGGHFSGSMDAAMQGLIEAPKTWHVGEFKTHNIKSFEKLKKEGVRLAKPEHWHQMNTYMGWSEMDRSAYFAVCKDTDEIYMERCNFDKAAFESDRAKAEHIIKATQPLARMSDDPTFYKCKFCNHHAICHNGKTPHTSCRTCVHATPVGMEDKAAKDGAWACEKFDKFLSQKEQLEGCDSHLMIPPLVSAGVPVEAGEEFVIYKHKQNGKTFVNATAIGMPPVSTDLAPGQKHLGIYTSKELSAIHPSMIADARLDQSKADFPDGKVIA